MSRNPFLFYLLKNKEKICIMDRSRYKYIDRYI